MDLKEIGLCPSYSPSSRLFAPAIVLRTELMMPENLFQLALKPSDLTKGILMTEEKAIYTSIRSLIITIGGRARKKKRRMSWDRGGECSSKKKRVMVLIDRTARAEQAMVWALTHVANKGDLVTLLHVLPPHCSGSAHREEETSRLIDSLGSICKAIRPQVRVEVLVIQGPKLATVLGQVKKLDVSVLVLKQSKPSPLCCMMTSSHEEFVEQCIDRAECQTMAVRKQSHGVGGYLVSTRWQKNFWLLA